MECRALGIVLFKIKYNFYHIHADFKKSAFKKIGFINMKSSLFVKNKLLN